MTRQERAQEIVKAIKPVGRPVDTNAVEVVHGYSDPNRFLPQWAYESVHDLPTDGAAA